MVKQKERCCFNCMNQTIVDCINGHFQIGCELDQFTECQVAGTDDYFEPLENKYKNAEK